jgi:hypothetical protein
MALPKQVAIATRIIVVAFGLFLIGSAVLSICDPSLGYSAPPYPTRTQAAVSSIWSSVYAVLLLIPPSLLPRKRSYLLGAVTVRGLGCAVVLFGVAKILWTTSGGTGDVLWTFIVTGVVLGAPAIFAVVELFFRQHVREQNLGLAED